MNFFIIWLGTSLLILIFVGWTVAWAIRTGQFRHQEEARYLPLRSGPPDYSQSERERGENVAT